VLISIQFTGSQVQVTWPEGTLQMADQVAGPYLDLTNVPSPYLFMPTGAVQFLRVKVR
jgi:hypothetical protein